MTFNDLEFKKDERKSWNGTDFVQAVVEFKNGYGASIVKGSFTYGAEMDLYELAVLHNGKVCYDSGLTDDVIGWLSEQDVTEWLGKIEALKGEKNA